MIALPSIAVWLGLIAVGNGSGLPEAEKIRAGQDQADPASIDNPSADLEAQLLVDLNRLRTAPASFLPVLMEHRSRYKGRRFEAPGEIAVLTNEGTSAVDEAMEFLRTAVPLEPLSRSEGMSRAAADHAADLGSTGNVGHYGSDGSTPSTRLRRYGSWKKTVAENVAMGSSTGRRILLQLLIDDGVASRGHRKNLFSRELAVVGIACGAHPVYRTVCVMDLAGGYEEAAKPNAP